MHRDAGVRIEAIIDTLVVTDDKKGLAMHLRYLADVVEIGHFDREVEETRRINKPVDDT